jgi:DNA-binding CsgD family transcriptional regulator
MAVPEPRRSDLCAPGHERDGGKPASHALGWATLFPATLSWVTAAVDRRRLLAVILLVSAVILGLAVLRRTYVSGWVGDTEADYCTLVIDQAVANLATFLKDYEDATFQFVANQDLNRLLLEYVSAADTYEIAPYNQAFSNFLEGYTFSRRGVYDALFLDESNRNRKALTMRESLPAAYIKALRDSGTYQETMRADGKAVWAFEENCASTGMDCVVVGRRIKHLFTQKPLGVVAIMIDADELVRVVNDYLHDHFYFSVGTVKANYTVVVDREGCIVSGPSASGSSRDEGLSLRQLYPNSRVSRAEGRFTGSVRGEDVLVIFRPVSDTGWRAFVPVSLAGLYAEESSGGVSAAGLSIPMAGGLIAGALAATAVFLFLWPRSRNHSPASAASRRGDEHVNGCEAPKSDPEWLGQLTDKEIQVLILMSQGYSNREIAQKTYIAEQTVKNYVSCIYSKLCVRDRVQASLLAVEAGLNLRDYRDFD